MQPFKYAAVGHLQGVSMAYRRKIEELGDSREHSWSAAHVWNRRSEKAAIGAIVAAPAGLFLTAVGVSASFFPPVVIAGGIAAGVALLASGVSLLKKNMESARADRLTRRISHYRIGGDEKSFEAELKANGASMLERMLSRRAAKQAEKESQRLAKRSAAKMGK